MITMCKDITTRINELENEINNISGSNKSFSFNHESSKKNSNHSKYNHTRQRPLSAPQDSSSTSLRIKLAHHMISQMQEKINMDESKNQSASTESKSQSSPSDKFHDIFQAAENTTKLLQPLFSTQMTTDDVNLRLPSEHYTLKCSPGQYSDTLASGGGYWKNIFHEISTPAEKESDAMKVEFIGKNSIPVISIMNPSSYEDRPHCKCFMKKTVDPVENIHNQKVTLVEMMNETNNNLLPFPLPSTKNEPEFVEQKKAIDKILIESLRGEIDKVRLKLSEIGKRPHEDKDPLMDAINSRDILVAEETSSGDHKNPSLLEELKNLQYKNEELASRLDDHKRLQESSMKKARDATHLLNAYETKVNALHEQALKSSKMMAHSKEKFCNILRSRNCQIKNLFEVNQQLKRTILANGEQMKQLKNNYKLLKTRYKELEEKNLEDRHENSKLRESMKKLERELKVVFSECSKLREDNILFLKELSSAKEEVSDKFTKQMNKHKNQVDDLLVKSRESETKLTEEVRDFSEQLNLQSKELGNIKLEVKSGMSELEMKYKMLLHDYENLVTKFKEYEQFDEIKCTCIEQELREFSSKMQEKESIILRERNDLRSLVEELARALKKNRAALQELTVTNHEQGEKIENLNTMIKSKDEQIMNYTQELSEARNLCRSLETELEAMNKIPLKTDETLLEENKKICSELESARKFLNDEKDNNLIKQKIIEDQELTLKNLKKQNEEKTKEFESAIENFCKIQDQSNQLSDLLRAMEVELDREKREKNKLLNDIEDINIHKESLMKRITDLEDTITHSCIGNEQTNSDQRQIIENMEEQMLRQKEDWETQKKILQKDKENALHAARFASQKLMDTVNDFQRQMCQQKAAQSKLAILLQGKEHQLESLTNKVKSLLPSEDDQSTNCNKTTTAKNVPQSHSICASFCQIKQIYPGPEQLYQSTESIDEKESKSFYFRETNSCSACCEYSDT